MGKSVNQAKAVTFPWPLDCPRYAFSTQLPTTRVVRGEDYVPLWLAEVEPGEQRPTPTDGQTSCLAYRSQYGGVVDRCVLTCMQFNRGDGYDTTKAAPKIRIRIKRSVGCNATPILTLEWNVGAYATTGEAFDFLAQVGNRATCGFEFDMALAPGETQPFSLDLAVIIDHGGNVVTVPDSNNVTIQGAEPGPHVVWVP